MPNFLERSEKQRSAPAQAAQQKVRVLKCQTINVNAKVNTVVTR